MKINHKLLKLVEYGMKTTTLTSLTESQVNGLYNRLIENKKESKEAVTKTSTTTTYDLGNTADVAAANKSLAGMATIDPNQKKMVVTKEGEMTEKAESKQQQKFMGLALSVKRGDTPKGEVSKDVKDVAKKMSEKDLEDFASTKHKGLPKKVKKEETKEEFGFGDYGKKLSAAVAGATKKNLGQISPSVSIGESKEAIIERKIIQLVEKHLTPKMTKQDFLNLVKEQGTKEAPVKTPVKTPAKPKKDNPYQPKHKPAPKAEVKEIGTKEAPVKTPVKTPTKPKKDNPYQPKHKPAPKAENKDLPEWLSFKSLGLKLK
jgi:hypothetical protein